MAAPRSIADPHPAPPALPLPHLFFPQVRTYLSDVVKARKTKVGK